MTKFNPMMIGYYF